MEALSTQEIYDNTAFDDLDLSESTRAWLMVQEIVTVKDFHNWIDQPHSVEFSKNFDVIAEILTVLADYIIRLVGDRQP